MCSYTSHEYLIPMIPGLQLNVNLLSYIQMKPGNVMHIECTYTTYSLISSALIITDNFSLISVYYTY